MRFSVAPAVTRSRRSLRCRLRDSHRQQPVYRDLAGRVAREPECLPGHNGRPGHGLDRCDGHEPALGHADGHSYEQRILQGMEDRCRQSDLELCSIQYCLELDRLLRDKRQRKRQLVLAVGQRLGTTEPQEFHLRRIGMRRTVCEHDRALPQQGLLLPRHGLPHHDKVEVQGQANGTLLGGATTSHSGNCLPFFDHRQLTRTAG